VISPEARIPSALVAAQRQRDANTYEMTEIISRARHGPNVLKQLIS
jgi:hypothetical protein